MPLFVLAAGEFPAHEARWGIPGTGERLDYMKTMTSMETKELQPFLNDAALQADLPEQAAELFACLAPDETRLATVYSDMTLSGHYGDRWLVVTDQRLEVISKALPA